MHGRARYPHTHMYVFSSLAHDNMHACTNSHADMDAHAFMHIHTYGRAHTIAREHVCIHGRAGKSMYLFMHVARTCTTTHRRALYRSTYAIACRCTRAITYTSRHAPEKARTHMHSHAHARIHTYACIHRPTYMHALAFTHIHKKLHVFTHIQTRIYMQPLTHMCAHPRGYYKTLATAVVSRGICTHSYSERLLSCI